jgi:hypothetical protein
MRTKMRTYLFEQRSKVAESRYFGYSRPSRHHHDLGTLVLYERDAIGTLRRVHELVNQRPPTSFRLNDVFAGSPLVADALDRELKQLGDRNVMVLEVVGECFERLFERPFESGLYPRSLATGEREYWWVDIGGGIEGVAEALLVEVSGGTVRRSITTNRFGCFADEYQEHDGEGRLAEVSRLDWAMFVEILPQSFEGEWTRVLGMPGSSSGDEDSNKTG